MRCFVVRLNGGLGNQLFQYALGRKLGMRPDAQVSYDLSFFHQGPGLHVQRPYELGRFRLELRAAKPWPIAVAKQRGSTVRAMLHALRPSLAPERPVMEQADSIFDPNILALDHDAYLDGYWQTEKYFADIAGTLRKDLTFQEPLDDANARTAAAIGSTATVSVHVRRGDYITHPAASAHMVPCGPAYYEAAMAHVLARVPNAHFFVFSDDLAWAKANLPAAARITFVEGNTGEDSWKDLQLMRVCKHHIIANSSFSWWGAWLAEGVQRIVIAPRIWFRDPKNEPKDLIPAGWTVL